MEYQFGKEKVKNILRDEDIDKIVTTFDKFTTVEKYSEVVKLKTIEENDYNLNISRYIDTSEEEEEIDVKKVIEEIKELKNSIISKELKLNEYLKELGFDEI